MDDLRVSATMCRNTRYIIELSLTMHHKLNLPLSVLILLIVTLCGTLAYVLMRQLNLF